MVYKGPEVLFVILERGHGSSRAWGVCIPGWWVEGLRCLLQGRGDRRGLRTTDSGSVVFL